jgi:hypothetical protein
LLSKTVEIGGLNSRKAPEILTLFTNIRHKIPPPNQDCHFSGTGFATGSGGMVGGLPESGGIGHVWNVAYQRSGINFIDAQAGKGHSILICIKTSCPSGRGSLISHHAMLTKTDAEALVREDLKRIQSAPYVLAINEAATIERSFGWVFIYNSRKFFETGNLLDQLAGNGPIIVNKCTGAVVHDRANQSVEAFIEEYERGL